MRSTFRATPLRNTPFEIQYQAAGQVYHTWYANPTLGIGETVYLQLKHNPTQGRLVHILLSGLRANGTDVTYKLYENPTIATDGTVLCDVSNRNHIIDTPPTLEMYNNPVGVTLPSAILRDESEIFGESQGGQGSSSSDPEGLFIETLLNPDSQYVVAITNNNGAERAIFFHLLWYETTQ